MWFLFGFVNFSFFLHIDSLNLLLQKRDWFFFPLFFCLFVSVSAVHLACQDCSHVVHVYSSLTSMLSIDLFSSSFYLSFQSQYCTLQLSFRVVVFSHSVFTL